MKSRLRRCALRVLNNCIRRNAWGTYVLFGVRVQSNKRIHWDFTTILLGQCLAGSVRPSERVLEIGTGPHALLSIYLAKRIGCDVTACDVNAAYVNEAIRTAQANRVAIRLVVSDLFASIDGRFDVVFFNSVYIPRAVGRKLGIAAFHSAEADWCGGNVGIETIERFLGEARVHMKAGARLVLGYNPQYLECRIVLRLCSKYNYAICRQQRSVFNPSRVIVVTRG